MNESVLTHADGRPYGMPRKAYVRMVDTKIWREWLEERGGADEAMRFVCAQVVGRASLKQIADHYGIDFGLLWDFVNETPERVERYRSAQKGMAEYLAGETLEIADETEPDTVGVSKVRIDQRNKLMKAWNRERYGDSESVLGAGLENLAAVLQRISERKLKQVEEVKPDITDIEEVEYEEVKRKEGFGEATEKVLVIAPVKSVIPDEEVQYL